jgi:hypothetical protein
MMMVHLHDSPDGFGEDAAIGYPGVPILRYAHMDAYKDCVGALTR